MEVVSVFDSGVFVLFVVLLWVTIGVVLSLWLGRRGHNPFGWFVLGAILGPVAIAFAVSSWRGDEHPEPRVVATGATSERHGAIDLLVGIDGSPEARAALDAAVELMGDRLGRLTLATVVPFDSGTVEQRTALATPDEEKARLAWLAPGAEVLEGHPSTALSTRAAEGGYDVLVTGTRGRGRAHLFGSAASDLARSSKVPVLLVGAGARS
jgi:nucleotide-binding universal stress UspA family protein